METTWSIYDISQGIMAMGFRSGETSNYDFVTNLLLSLLWKNFYQNTSGDEIANVDFFTTTSYIYRPAPTPTESTS